MKILHMLWLPFAYWFFPFQLANNALRGTLKNYGVNLAVIPNDLSQEISGNIIKRQKLHLKKPSVFKQLYELQILIDHDALVMKKLINHEYQREREFTPEVENINQIMLKHAVRKLRK